VLTKLFPQNESLADRGIRIVLGLIGLALVFWWPRTAWGLFGLIPLVTGIIGNCPLYTVLGVSTRKPSAATPRL
jgi:predicted RND superfamily exporter protein